VTEVFPLWGMQTRPYVVRREYRTESIVSRAGREQRRALRETPRKSIEFTTQVIDPLWLTFNQTMADAQRSDWYLPDQSRVVALSNGMAVGDTVTLGAVPAWAVAGAQIVLRDYDRLERYEIYEVDGLTLTFVETAASEWPVGTLMYPALYGAIAAELTTASLLRSALSATVRFDADPGADTIEAPLAADETFNGRDVWRLRPYRLAPVEIAHNQVREIVDYGQGRVSRYHPEAFAARLWRGAYPTRDSVRPNEIRSLFDRMQGQAGEFYMPTFERDLVPSVQAGSGTNVLRVAGTAVWQRFAGSTTYRAVAVYLAGGTVLFNRVTDIDEDYGDSVLTFAENWTQDVPIDARISWMPVWRFATDILEIAFMFNLDKPPKLWSSAMLTFRMLEDLDG